MGEKESSILSRPLRDTTKLAGVKDTMLDSIELKSPTNHLLNELAQHIK